MSDDDAPVAWLPDLLEAAGAGEPAKGPRPAVGHFAQLQEALAACAPEARAVERSRQLGALRTAREQPGPEQFSREKAGLRGLRKARRAVDRCEAMLLRRDLGPRALAGALARRCVIVALVEWALAASGGPALRRPHTDPRGAQREEAEREACCLLLHDPGLPADFQSVEWEARQDRGWERLRLRQFTGAIDELERDGRPKAEIHGLVAAVARAVTRFRSLNSLQQFRRWLSYYVEDHALDEDPRFEPFVVQERRRELVRDLVRGRPACEVARLLWSDARISAAEFWSNAAKDLAHVVASPHDLPEDWKDEGKVPPISGGCAPGAAAQLGLVLRISLDAAPGAMECAEFLEQDKVDLCVAQAHEAWSVFAGWGDAFGPADCTCLRLPFSVERVAPGVHYGHASGRPLARGARPPPVATLAVGPCDRRAVCCVAVAGRDEVWLFAQLDPTSGAGRLFRAWLARAKVVTEVEAWKGLCRTAAGSGETAPACRRLVTRSLHPLIARRLCAAEVETRWAPPRDGECALAKRQMHHVCVRAWAWWLEVDFE